MTKPHHIAYRLLAGLCLCAWPASAQTPAITFVANAAGNLLPGLPNAGIAQGSILVVYGTGLGPGDLVTAPNAFQSTTLSGTSVTVTVNSTTVNALMYYTSSTQVAALLPSNTPTGQATVTVTYNSGKSAPAPFAIVANAPGIFTVDSTGSGPAIVSYPDYSLVSALKSANCGGPNTTCGAANPGDTLILWATGLGPVSGDDASGSGLGQNMARLPVNLWIGNTKANIVYQGRSGCCIGVDQIVFTVPDDVLTGCAVPLVVEIANNSAFVSNTTAIPIARTGRNCSLGQAGLTGNTPFDVTQLTGTVPLGGVELDHFSNFPGAGFVDQGQVFFAAVTAPSAVEPFSLTYLDNLPLGACLSDNGARQNSNPLFTNTVPLDGGSSFTISGPNGSKTVSASPGQSFTLGNTGNFLSPGDYTITSAGGKDVGPFSVTVHLPALPTLTSPVSANGLTVSRSKGMTVTWDSSGASGYVQIVISSALGTISTVNASCSVPANAGTFTIPPYVLESLPNGTRTGFKFQPGDGAGGGPATETIFTASGIAFGLAQTFVDGVAIRGFPIGN